MTWTSVWLGLFPSMFPLQGDITWPENALECFRGMLVDSRVMAPVLKLALDAGCEVELCAVGTVETLIGANKLQLDPRIMHTTADDKDGVELFMRSLDDLFVVTASQSLGENILPGTQLSVDAIMAARHPILFFEDMYGSGHDTLRLLQTANGLHKITCFCVSDEFSRDLLVHNGFDLNGRVVVTGGPQFDGVPAMIESWSTKREEIRSKIPAGDHEKVFLIVGGKGGDLEILQLIEMAVTYGGYAGSSKLIFLPHPGAPQGEKVAVQQYMKSAAPNYFSIDRTVFSDINDLLFGADFILSAFSTMGTLGVLCGMAGVVYVGTPACQADLLRQKKIAIPPEVKSGAGWYVRNAPEMLDVIRNLNPGPSDELAALMGAQAKIASYADGKSAERIWQEMQKLLDLGS